MSTSNYQFSVDSIVGTMIQGTPRTEFKDGSRRGDSLEAIFGQLNTLSYLCRH